MGFTTAAPPPDLLSGSIVKSYPPFCLPEGPHLSRVLQSRKKRALVPHCCPRTEVLSYTTPCIQQISCHFASLLLAEKSARFSGSSMILASLCSEQRNKYCSVLWFIETDDGYSQPTPREEFASARVPLERVCSDYEERRHGVLQNIGVRAFRRYGNVRLSYIKAESEHASSTPAAP